MQLVPFLESQFFPFLGDYNFLVGGIFMDLSKVFDCIPHDLLIPEFAAYGFKETALK